jgi:hypothetical protein
MDRAGGHLVSASANPPSGLLAGSATAGKEIPLKEKAL